MLFREVADSLREQGHEVDFVDAQQHYRDGQGAGGRMRRELAGLGRMLRAGLRQRRPDVVISGTSPPCLLVLATLLARRFRARSIHWAMDLYPELAVALGEIPPGGMAAGIETAVRCCYRRTDLTLALDGDMAAHLRELGARTECLRPWVSDAVWAQAQSLREVGVAAPAGEPWTWIYSGNLGRAHEWEALLATQQIIERMDAGIRLVFQGGGPSWTQAQERARTLELKNVEWRPYAEEKLLVESLLACHASVVTQRPETAGLLWPSKLGLVLTLPRPLLFIGSPDGAIARDLQSSRHAGVFAPSQVEAIAGWLLEQRRKPAAVSLEETFDAGAHRTASLKRWKEIVAGK